MPIPLEIKVPMHAGGRFAIISHALPPSPSGQALLLQRLLDGFDRRSYGLINTSKEYALGQSGSLPAECHILRSPLHIPVLEIPPLSWIPILVNTFLGILSRSNQIEKIVYENDYRLLIGCTGDLYDLPATWLASRRTGIPFMAYIMDDYVFQWMGFRRRVARWLEPRILKSAKKIMVLNEFVRRSYFQRYGLQCEVIHNPVSIPPLPISDKEEPIFDRSRIHIVYAGSIYHAHFGAFRNLINALNSREDAGVILHIYTAQSVSGLEQKGIKGPLVTFHPHIPQDEVFRVLRQADILFLPLAFNSPIPEVINTSAPFKLGEYLAAARPILVHAPAESFLSWYFMHYNCGVVVDQDDPKVLGAVLDRILHDENLRRSLQIAAYKRAREDFDISAIRMRFTTLLDEILKSPSRDDR